MYSAPGPSGILRCDLKNHRQPSEKSILQTVCDLCDVIFAEKICTILLIRTFTLEITYLYILYTFSVYVPLPRLDEPPAPVGRVVHYLDPKRGVTDKRNGGDCGAM